MKFWKCPVCKRERKYEGDLVMKICTICDCGMEVVEDE